jgi:hypothetical protein
VLAPLESNLPESNMLYGIAQCGKNLNPGSCSICQSINFSHLLACSGGTRTHLLNQRSLNKFGGKGMLNLIIWTLHKSSVPDGCYFWSDYSNTCLVTTCFVATVVALAEDAPPEDAATEDAPTEDAYPPKPPTNAYLTVESQRCLLYCICFRRYEQQ